MDMITPAVCAPPACAERTPSLALRLAEFMRGAFWRRRAINDLEKLDDRALRDIGVERGDIATHVDRAMTRITLSTLGR
jgi:uncharacterized protein YjiS (DUF1127 family)